MQAAMSPIASHYARSDLLDAILAGLRKSGKDIAHLVADDLAPVDEFHTRGREATAELASRARLTPGLRILDIGSGLGGSARYLAATHGCAVTGIDLTAEYVELAHALAGLVGLDEAVTFRQGSALALPFVEATFDVAWTEHAQMNIADKHKFYGEIARVLAPGGRLVFHDVFQGGGGDPHFPVPWAGDASLSFLPPPHAVRGILGELDFEILDWEDRTAHSRDWFSASLEKLKASWPPPLGTHLLMGPTALTKLENVVRNLQEGRIAVVQAVARKRSQEGGAHV
jgi:ubiquinone/menaquinone biosynthesis C-methylase UbiE